MTEPTLIPIFTSLTFEQLGATVLSLMAERDSLKAELAALRAQRVPMTEDQSIDLIIKCETDWNKTADKSTQWAHLYWEEYSVIVCRAVEAFHGIGAKP